jgi:chaperonin cofactor prefoldin
LQDREKRIDELLGLVTLKEQEGRNEADRLGFECHKLREEVEVYKKLSNVEYVRSLERKVKDLKETVSSQEEDYKVLAKKNEESSLEIEQLRREVAELQVGNSLL